MSNGDPLAAILSREPRDFKLSGREADLLIDCIGAYVESYRMAGVAAEDVEDHQSDSETMADCHDLQQRLGQFLGFERKPRYKGREHAD